MGGAGVHPRAVGGGCQAGRWAGKGYHGGGVRV